jgi:hypothetical protein
MRPMSSSFPILRRAEVTPTAAELPAPRLAVDPVANPGKLQAAGVQLDREQTPAHACGCRTVDARELAVAVRRAASNVDKLGDDLRI